MRNERVSGVIPAGTKKTKVTSKGRSKITFSNSTISSEGHKMPLGLNKEKTVTSNFGNSSVEKGKHRIR